MRKRKNASQTPKTLKRKMQEKRRALWRRIRCRTGGWQSTEDWLLVRRGMARRTNSQGIMEEVWMKGWRCKVLECSIETFLLCTTMHCMTKLSDVQMNISSAQNIENLLCIKMTKFGNNFSFLKSKMMCEEIFQIPYFVFWRPTCSVIEYKTTQS